MGRKRPQSGYAFSIGSVAIAWSSKKQPTVLHTLRGEYEAKTSEPNVVFCKQHYFREMWTKTKVFTFFWERMN